MSMRSVHYPEPTTGPPTVLYLIRSEAEQKLSPEVRARRNAIEVSISQLRDRKRTLAEDDYYQQLEALLLDLARLYEENK